MVGGIRLNEFPICQIVGYKNAGKTTLMQWFIRYYSKRDLHVGTLKHHGHGGEPETVIGTDSFKHIQAGSAMSAVQGENQLHFTINHSGTFNIHKTIAFYRMLPIDILLIEGYKQADYPKIVLVRDQDDLHLLDELTNIIAVGSWQRHLTLQHPFFTFSLQEMDDHLPSLAAEIIGLGED